MYAEYNYMPTDLDDELFLSEVPVELLQSSLATQFQEPIEYRKKDYIQSFIMKYQFSKDNMLEDDLIMLDIQYDKFLAFVEKTFYTYLNVGFTNIDSLPEEDVLELIHLTYRFFIKNIKKNFVNVILNYIEDNREFILENYEKKKDVTALNFKSEIDDDYDILVLSNLADIISNIIENLKKENDVDKFLDMCKGNEPILELDYVIYAFNEMELTGNFIEKYLEMIDTEFEIILQSKVRNKILKKYPNREPRYEEESNIDETSEDETEENIEDNEE